MKQISEKKLNNHIYLMDTISDLYRKKHRVGIKRFLNLCKQTDLMDYICKNSFAFDGLPDEEMLKEVEGYIDEKL